MGGKGENLQRKRDCEGFTLVELIVVIVILAILAAILVPGLLSWTDKAKEKKYELEARSIAQAVQAEVAKLYAKGEKPALTKLAETEHKDGPYVIGFSGIIDGVGYQDAHYHDELDDIIALSGVQDIEYVYILWKSG